MGNSLFAAMKAKEQTLAVAPKVDQATDSRFNLISTLISTPDVLSDAVKAYRTLEKLIRTDFLRLVAGVGIPGESALYNELLMLLKDLQDLVEFPHLANKNVLAVGGGFSSGKSGFLNAILGEDQLLPEDIDPTTAIPTYLTHADDERILALNTFNRSQVLTREELNAISHLFNKGQKQGAGRISFYHILKLLQIQAPSMRWKNIALLDTPGYSKPHTDEDGSEVGSEAGNTDEEKAREHLSQADHLIWSVAAKDGVMQGTDIAFLQDKVKWTRPLYIIMNKSDELAASDVEGNFKSVLAAAKKAGFEIAGASAYSARRKKVYCGDDPVAWFDAIDAKCKYTQWRGRFKTVIEKVIKYNSDEAKNMLAIETALRPIVLKDLDIGSDQKADLEKAYRSISSERKSHASATEQFKFFGDKVEKQLNAVLDIIGVTDETAAAIGLEAKSTGDARLLALKQGDRIEGKVDAISKFFGCFISSDAASDQIRIKYADIQKHYTEPEKAFTVGTHVVLTVYEVDLRKGLVSFTVMPAEMSASACTNSTCQETISSTGKNKLKKNTSKKGK